MGLLIIISQFVLSLSILIVLHELGHFLPAKWFKTRVEKFYLFFDPWFSLVKKKVGETEYGIGWLPLGGYVKISGMIDESMDREQMEGPPQPWEFRSKPAWQRLVIMLGGVTVNFILGFLLFGMVLFFWGSSYLPTSSVLHGYQVDSLAKEIGLMNGDNILSIGGKPYDRYDIGAFKKAVVIEDASEMMVERDGNRIGIPIDEKYVGLLSSYAYKDAALFAPRVPAIIAKVQKGTPAEKAGLLAEDRLIAVNDQPTPFFDQFFDKLQANKGQELTIRYVRDDREGELLVTSNEKGMIGFQAKSYLDQLELEQQAYTLAEAIPAGISQGSDFLTSQLKAFGKMFSGKIKASESLGGFGTIGGLFPNEWDWRTFWYVTGVLSLILGFMNLLPIPALDGGHVMFLLYEVVTGKKVSDKFMEYATLIGFALVIGLVLFANGLDVMRWWKG